MWFKQATVYQIDTNNLPSYEELEEKLSLYKFNPIEGLAWFSEGFITPVGSSNLVFLSGDAINISLKREERILPSSVINKKLNKKIIEIEETELRRVGKKEKSDLRDHVVDNLLPYSFTKDTFTNGIISKTGLLIINQTSKSIADSFTSQLRTALGGLKGFTITTNTSLPIVMTKWVANRQAEGNFSLGDYCEICGNSDDKSVIKMYKKDITEDEVVKHINNQNTVTELALIWKNQISFVLSHDFTIKRIRFFDVLQEPVMTENDNIESLSLSINLIIERTLSEMYLELVDLCDGFRNKI